MILLFASLFFYAWGEPVNILLMVISIIIGWALGIAIERSEGKARKNLLILGITIYILEFFVFKYLTFVSKQIELVLNYDLDISIALPIGISFFLFQLMSYLFDVYYKNASAQINCLNVGLYISLFPQLIAGPIVRYSEINEQIGNRHESREDLSEGLVRFIFGLGKKVLISNNLGLIADSVFAAVGQNAVMTAWIGAVAYTLQIYFDFSGYSDMAIGLGRMFGFKFAENFNYPYIASSVTDFWRRWHISLSTWFRDYVYIPLGGNQVKKSRWFLNMFIVWLLTGIWHGANWTFIVWGLFYFIVLMIEKCIHLDKVQGYMVLRRVYTLFVVVIAWVLFRVDSLSQGFQYISNLFVPSEGFWNDDTVYCISNGWIFFLIGFIFATPIMQRAYDYLQRTNKQWINLLFNGIVFFLSVISCISSSYNPFIYFNF